MPHGAAQCSPDKPMCAVGVVMEAYLQWDQACFPQVYALDNLMGRPIPEVQLPTVFPGCDIVQIETSQEEGTDTARNDR